VARTATHARLRGRRQAGRHARRGGGRPPSMPKAAQRLPFRPSPALDPAVPLLRPLLPPCSRPSPQRVGVCRRPRRRRPDGRARRGRRRARAAPGDARPGRRRPAAARRARRGGRRRDKAQAGARGFGRGRGCCMGGGPPASAPLSLPTRTRAPRGSLSSTSSPLVSGGGRARLRRAATWPCSRTARGCAASCTCPSAARARRSGACCWRGASPTRSPTSGAAG
jgi:hypothetical protein